MEDTYIIQMLRAHHEQALHEIKQRYHSLFIYILSQKGLSQEDIDECLNDIYWEIWKSKDRFDETKGSLKTFICAIARHVSYHKLRKKHYEDKHRCETDMNVIAEKTNNYDADRDILLSIMKKLNKHEKQLFYRKYYYMQSTAQIASELCMTLKAVESRLYRLRKKIQVLWEEENT